MATRQDYLHEVEQMREQVARLEQAITEAVRLAFPALQQVAGTTGVSQISSDAVSRTDYPPRTP